MTGTRVTAESPSWASSPIKDYDVAFRWLEAHGKNFLVQGGIVPSSQFFGGLEPDNKKLAGMPIVFEYFTFATGQQLAAMGTYRGTGGLAVFGHQNFVKNGCVFGDQIGRRGSLPS